MLSASERRLRISTCSGIALLDSMEATSNHARIKFSREKDLDVGRCHPEKLWKIVEKQFNRINY